ncbi:YceI family protein [Terriglobus saanensis]|uniref:YceI family protein n=1 Tax=Terriglobus saanensis (strain ATCC BAA-1853 / DSM 23119 / SP1PR4) TaxID=401053 RepID=E8V495_TERSS|nr:YceI family protein [Terriglobus saanensis]ADV83644.1 YceI family protein [Terriglobus saanensis SP1PR4]
MKFFRIMSLVVSLVPAAFAQHQTFTVTPDASEVRIKLNTTHEVVNGTFHVQSGSISFDRAITQISGLVTVVAGSGKTGNDSRDKKMNKDILKVDQFTTVSFAPKAYRGMIVASGDSTIQVSGVFTLLGTGHDITVPMQIRIVGSTATAKAQFAVPYVQWGLRNPSFLFWKAENDVAVDLSLVGSVSK